MGYYVTKNLSIVSFDKCWTSFVYICEKEKEKSIDRFSILCWRRLYYFEFMIRCKNIDQISFALICFGLCLKMNCKEDVSLFSEIINS